MELLEMQLLYAHMQHCSTAHYYQLYNEKALFTQRPIMTIG